MSVTTAEHLIRQLRWRYATKQFDPTKKIPAGTWTNLEEALVLTPSSFGLQPWRFIVVNDPEVRGKLRAASWNQSQVTEASHFVVFAVHKENTPEHVDRLIDATAAATGQPADTPRFAGLKKVILDFGKTVSNQEWNSRQAYIALGNFMLSAALLGLDTCPLEGMNPVKYDEILGLPELGMTTAVACAAGYRAETDKYAASPKVRFPREEVVLHI